MGRERDQLGAITGVPDVELGDHEDEEQDPQPRRLRVERAVEISDADQVGGDRCSRDREGERAWSSDLAEPAKTARSQGHSQRSLSRG